MLLSSKSSNLEGKLSLQQEIQFLPTATDTLEYFSVWVDEQQLAIEQEPYRTTINPEDFSIGNHLLRIVSKGPEGTTISLFPFSAGELDSASWEDVEPIMEQHCLACHGANAMIPLHNKDRWELNIEPIISEVSTQSMPLGGPFLSEEEIIYIRAWKQGGFQ